MGNLPIRNMPDTSISAGSHGQDEIVFRTQIGKGSYGEVWQAKWNEQEVAAKIIHPEFFNEEYGKTITNHYIREFSKEWEVLRNLDHPNIVKMHTVLLPPNKSPVIVMELMHCDLFHYIKNSTSTPKVSPSKGLSIGLGIAEGLEYLHGLTPPVVHRDIATKNILLTVDDQPKIADLGVAKIFAAGMEAFATVGPGTPVYAAPETYLDTVNNKAKYGVKADTFSFGVTLLAMVVGHEPIVFPEKIKEDGSWISEIERRETDMSQIKGHRLEKIIIECLQDDSSDRPHASEIVRRLQVIEQKAKIGQLAKCTSDAEFVEVMKQSKYDHVFKVIFLGSSGVGKSCLVNLLEDENYPFKDQVSTIGVDFKCLSYKYNSKYIRVDITDTQGEERYHSITPNFIRNSHGVFLVYDISDIESFEMLPYWLEMIEWYAPENCKILLVGNKVDLREPTSDKPLGSSKRPLVALEKALIFATNLGIPYMESSAKDINSIRNMLQKMVEMLMSTASVCVEDIHVQEERLENIVSLSAPAKQNKRKRCKCS